MLYSLRDIETQVPPQVFAGGWQWFIEGRVTAPSVVRGGEIVSAVIHQTGGRPLRVYVRIHRQDDGLTIRGECTCPRREICEHVVAVLLQALGEHGELPARPQGGERGPSGKAGGDSAADSEGPVQSPQALIYVLSTEEEGPSVESLVARRRADGGYTPGRPFDPRRAQRGIPARFLLPVDLELLAALVRLPCGYDNGQLLQGPGSDRLLQSLLDTGRLHLLDDAKPLLPLRWGSGRPVMLQWRADATGTQHIEGRTEPRCDLLLHLGAPWYLDAARGECGPVESDIPAATLATVLQWPPVPPQQAREVCDSFARLFAGTSLPPPRCFAIEKLPRSHPVPHLCLTSESLDWDGFIQYDDFARLRFDYGGVELDPAGADTRLVDGRVLCVRRNRRAEREAAQLLQRAGLDRDEWIELVDDGARYRTDGGGGLGDDEAWLDFQADTVPALRNQGWRISYRDFRFRLSEPSRWTCAVEQLAGSDWFTFSMGIEVEGREIDLLPILLDALQQLPPELLQRGRTPVRGIVLPWTDPQRGACLLQLPADRVLPLLQILLELHREGSAQAPSSLRLSRWELARLAALEPAEDDGGRQGLQWLCDSEAQELLHRLRHLEGIPGVSPPRGLQAELRPYQQAGLDWLQFLRQFRFGGILADDMGLGKTLQALAHLLLEKEAGRADLPSLVVAPTSLMFNWLHEARRFTPGLKVLVLQGTQRKNRFSRIAEHDLVLTTYPLLARDQQTLLAQAYHLLILDEAQVIKNPRAQASQVVRRFNARHRLCLTGTPMENHLGELWSLFDVLLPGLLGDRKGFGRWFRTPIEKYGNDEAARRLHRRVRPFLLRRTKQEVAADLPDKTDIVQRVVLEGRQRELYETVRLAMHRRVREEVERQGLARSHIVVLDALLKLRQVCCDPRLVDSERARAVGESAKLEMLLQLLPEMVEEGRRILLFSQFTGMLALIEEAVKKAGIDYAKLTGRTQDRQAPVQRFQRGEVPLFLISLKAGGVGLNLTAADTVIHYDPWWNPAVERQATDRAHRIGQRQRVFVYKLICAGTVEEKIQLMQQRKQALADSLYDEGGNREPQWRSEDLEELFGSLPATAVGM